MKKHTLICSLKDDPKGTFKSVKLSSEPNEKKLREVYYYNLEALKYVVKYCQDNNILSLRVISSLFPLSSHIDYRQLTQKLIEEIGPEYKKIDFSNIELSSHPDQFILLSSLNPNINEMSRYELEIYAHIRQYIPWNLVNIHIGSKSKGFEEHSKIIKKELSLLSQEAKQILSFENDEKSYSFSETLTIAQENDIMMVPDFHHERCSQKRTENNGLNLTKEEHIAWNHKIDETIYSKLDDVISTYNNKQASPLFHISSPVFGWNGNFKDHCQHSDFIDPLDYPKKLELEMSKRNLDYRLDIEAKAKNQAIFSLKTI